PLILLAVFELFSPILIPSSVLLEIAQNSSNVANTISGADQKGKKKKVLMNFNYEFNMLKERDYLRSASSPIVTTLSISAIIASVYSIATSTSAIACAILSSCRCCLGIFADFKTLLSPILNRNPILN
ncbi:hypothetical protein H5410_050466, partial [Solanum commersonii]